MIDKSKVTTTSHCFLSSDDSKRFRLQLLNTYTISFMIVYVTDCIAEDVAANIAENVLETAAVDVVIDYLDDAVIIARDQGSCVAEYVEKIAKKMDGQKSKSSMPVAGQ